MARDWAVRLTPVRPSTPLVLEARATETVPSRAPALAAVTPMLPEAPAARLAGLATDKVARPVVAVASRLSWKAASVATVLVTATWRRAPVRTLPKATAVAAKSARARS